MLVISGVEIETDDLTRVVDADHFSPAGAWEVDIAERAASVRKAVEHTCQVLVSPDDQTRRIDARREAQGRARNRENLVGAAGESEGGQGRVAAGIDCEPAHRRRAVTVEDQRLRRAREVDACERIDLRDRQTLSHGVVAGRD